MHIEWFTVVAQLVNFVVLVWLLKRFLYKPVLDAIDQREQKIATELEGARQREAEASAKIADYEKKIEVFDRERKALEEQMLAEAATVRDRKLDELRSEVAKRKESLDKSLLEQQELMAKEIANRTKREVFRLARVVLQSLASTQLEEQVVEVFASRMSGLSELEKKELAMALDVSMGEVKVLSAFELNADLQNKIMFAVEQCLGQQLSFVFEVHTELVCGIELRIGGYKLAWNVAGYVDAVSGE